MASPQLPLDLMLERAATFEHFVAGNNGPAVAALQAAAVQTDAAWPLLCGGVGLGKTHLLNAACHEASDSDRRAMLLSAGMIQQHDPELLSHTGRLDLLAIDDVDLLIGDRHWDEALFHLFNRLRQQSATLILSSTTEAAALQPALPDLKSRLAWGVTFTIEPLNESARVELLKRRARGKGIDLGNDVIGWLLRRAPRDVASLLDLLARLEHASLVEKRRVTVPFLREQFPELRSDK